MRFLALSIILRQVLNQRLAFLSGQLHTLVPVAIELLAPLFSRIVLCLDGPETMAGHTSIIH